MRVVAEAEPRWALFENPTGIYQVGFEGIVANLEDLSYDIGVVEIPAIAVNSPQERTRVLLVAHSNREQWCSDKRKSDSRTNGRNNTLGSTSSSFWNTYEVIKGYRAKPGVCGLAHGVSRGLLKALGNAIVPQVASEVIAAMVSADGQHPAIFECGEDNREVR
jgi:hypothetical protein